MNALTGIKLPNHKGGMTLEHNPHKTVYETVDVYMMGREREFGTDELYRQAVDTEELWTIQWYPDTPVGFISIAAPTLGQLLSLLAVGVQEKDLILYQICD